MCVGEQSELRTSHPSLLPPTFSPLSSADLPVFSVVLFRQVKELQTLHNLRKLFVQDLTARVKKVAPLRLVVNTLRSDARVL